jgi:hypothetical protein
VIGDDVSPFFVPGEFAGGADTLDGVSAVGIFSADFAVNGGGLGISDTKPVYLMPTLAVPAAVIGMALVASSQNFTVVDTVVVNGDPATMLLILECA